MLKPLTPNPSPRNGAPENYPGSPRPASGRGVGGKGLRQCLSRCYANTTLTAFSLLARNVKSPNGFGLFHFGNSVQKVIVFEQPRIHFVSSFDCTGIASGTLSDKRGWDCVTSWGRGVVAGRWRVRCCGRLRINSGHAVSEDVRAECERTAC